jgi:hypothetical protein
LLVVVVAARGAHQHQSQSTPGAAPQALVGSTAQSDNKQALWRNSHEQKYRLFSIKTAMHAERAYSDAIAIAIAI